MWKSIRNNCKNMSESWSVLVVFAVMCYAVLNNFVNNVNQYQGRDVIAMYHPMRLLTLTQDTTTGILIMQLLPLLVVLPCGFVYMKDRDAGVEVFEISRSGAKIYYVSKLIAVFLVTMSVFIIPLLLEVALNVISFPLEATGDLSNMTIYSQYLIDQIKNYLFFEIYLVSPYLYAVVSILMFGIWTGILATFVVAISFLPFVKARLILFLPLYIISSCLELLQRGGLTEVETYYGYYFFMYAGENLSRIGYVTVLLLFVVTTIGITWWKCKEDCRNR